MKTTIEMYLNNMTTHKNLEKKYHGFEDYLETLTTEEHKEDEFFEFEKLNTDTNFMYLAFAVFELDTTPFIDYYHSNIVMFDTATFIKLLVEKILLKVGE